MTDPCTHSQYQTFRLLAGGFLVRCLGCGAEVTTSSRPPVGSNRNPQDQTPTVDLSRRLPADPPSTREPHRLPELPATEVPAEFAPDAVRKLAARCTKLGWRAVVTRAEGWTLAGNAAHPSRLVESWAVRIWHPDGRRGFATWLDGKRSVSATWGPRRLLRFHNAVSFGAAIKEETIDHEPIT